MLLTLDMSLLVPQQMSWFWASVSSEQQEEIETVTCLTAKQLAALRIGEHLEDEKQIKLPSYRADIYVAFQRATSNNQLAITHQFCWWLVPLSVSQL